MADKLTEAITKKALAQQYAEKLRRHETRIKEKIQNHHPDYFNKADVFLFPKFSGDLDSVMSAPIPSRALEEKFGWLLDAAVPPGDRALVLHYADHLTDYPYSDSYTRRPFRVNGHRPYSEKLLSILRPYIKGNGLIIDTPLDKILNQDLPSDALAYIQEQSIGHGCGYSAWQVAYALDQRDPSVEEAVTRILTEDNSTTRLTRTLLYGICLSHRTDFHELLGKLLLAARLQEGLRQSICETADCGTIEAFLTIIKVIADNNLIRYSSVKRAVGTWLGLITEETRDLDRISGKSLRLAVDCLEQEQLRQECLASQDAMAIHIALWSYAVYDVDHAIAKIVSMAQKGTKHQLLAAGYFTNNLNLPTISNQITKIVLQNHSQQEDVLAVWLPFFLPLRYHAVYSALKEGRPIDYRIWFQSKEEIREHYDLIKKIASGFSGKSKTFSPCVFPWYEATICKSDFAQILCTLAPMTEESELIDEACGFLKDCSANDRSSCFAILLRDPQSPTQRKTAIEGLADKESLTRNEAFKVVSKLSLTPEEYRSTEDFLRLKNPEIRKNVLSLLIKQEDAPLHESLARLLASNKEEVRLGALDLLLQLKENPARETLADSFTSHLRDRATEPDLPSKEKILLDRLVPNTTEETSQGTELFSAQEPYCPKNFDMDYLGLCLKTFTTYFPESKLPEMLSDTSEAPFQEAAPELPPCPAALVAALDLLSLSKWIDAHKTESIVCRNGETTLLGNISFAYHLKQQDGSLPLMPLWQEWIRNNSITNKRLLAAMILFLGFREKTSETEACIPLLQSVFGKGFVYCQKLPYSEVIEAVLTDLCKAIPREDLTRLACAISLWFIRCVPKDKVILSLPDEYAFQSGKSLMPLLKQKQLRLLYQELKCRKDETLKHTFPLAVAATQRIAEARIQFPDPPPMEPRFFGNYDPTYSQLDYRIKEVCLADPKAYIYAAYEGILSKAQLYTYILSPSSLKNSLELITTVSSAYYERGKEIASHDSYKSYRDGRLLEIFLGKEKDLTDEDEKLIAFVVQIYEDLIPMILSAELSRGDSPTVYTQGISSINRIYGVDYLVQILLAMGKDTLDRNACNSWSHPTDRRGVLSYLLSICIPKNDDSDYTLKAALAGKKISEKRLIEAALFSPEWIPLVGEYLTLPAFSSVCYYFMAHMKEAFDNKRQAMIAQYTPLTPEELYLGAFDVQWFRSAYESIDEKEFNLIYEAAKYTTDGAKHTRARKYADAVLGKIDPKECEGTISEKRNKDLLMAYALIPLRDEEDLCRRYLFIQAFRKESKRFGPQRSASESKAADMAMKNLATNAGYTDPMHLTLRMEAKVIENHSNLLNQQVIEGTSFQIIIDERGKASLEITKDGKPLKSIPAKLKKQETVVAMTAMVKTLTEQYRRTRQLLEEAMEDRTVFLFHDLSALTAHPVVAPMLKNLVLLSGENVGFLSEKGLTDNAGELHLLEKDAQVYLAHPYDLYRLGRWRNYQKYLYDNRITQAFRQVFRELYIKTPEEENLFHSLRYAGNQLQPKKTVGALKGRRWVADIEDGLQKVYYKENIVAHIYALADWFSPADIEAPTLEWVCFTDRKTGESLRINQVPHILFSEVMRDVDLAVSVAHAGGVDPETSHSTIEMRSAILEFVLPMFRLSNVRLEGTHAIIEGSLAEYSVHLGSGVVHQIGGTMIPVLPVHSQHSGKFFLPFVDEDPKTAEIISKVLLFAEDHKIMDPTILSQISK